MVVRKKEFKSEEDLPEACSDLSAAYLSFKQASTAEETDATRRAVTAASLELSTVPTLGGIVAILPLVKLMGGIVMRQGLSTDWTTVDGYCHLEKSNHYAKMILMAAMCCW